MKGSLRPRPAPVLLMIHSLGHGGSERQLANAALAMDPARFIPHVASVAEGFHAGDLRRAGVPILHLPLRSFYHPSTWTIARSLGAYIRRHGIQLVHAFDYTMSVFGVAAARTFSPAVVLSSQRCYMDLVPPRYRYPLALTHRLAHGVVTNCEEMRRHLSQDYSYPAHRIHVCYNGLDTSRFSAAGRLAAGASLTIGTVCVLRPEKNLAQLLQAFQRVRAQRAGLRLLIVGSGPEWEPLHRLSAELGIAADCTFLPGRSEVAEVLRGIDVFVHPSLSEALPNAVMEAMACGCCVIASRVGGCPEVIQCGDNGLLARPGELEDLTHQLGRATQDTALRARLGAAAAERMKDFSIAKAAERTQQIYDTYLDPVCGAD